MVFFHQQPEIIVLGLEAHVLVAEEELVGPRSELFIDDGVGACFGVADFDDVQVVHKVGHGGGFVTDGQQGGRSGFARHVCERMAWEEQAILFGCDALQGLDRGGVGCVIVFDLEVLQERSPGQFGAAVAADFLLQFAF